VLIFYFSYYRHELYDWFCSLKYGREKWEYIKVIRYPESYNTNWEKELLNAVKFLFECKYSFTQKEKENYSRLLKFVDFEKYPELKKLKVMECPGCKETVVIKWLSSSFPPLHNGKCPNCRDIIYSSA
jgi:hypothetical protein